MRNVAVIWGLVAILLFIGLGFKGPWWRRNMQQDYLYVKVFGGVCEDVRDALRMYIHSKRLLPRIFGSDLVMSKLESPLMCVGRWSKKHNLQCYLRVVWYNQLYYSIAIACYDRNDLFFVPYRCLEELVEIEDCIGKHIDDLFFMEVVFTYDGAIRVLEKRYDKYEGWHPPSYLKELADSLDMMMHRIKSLSHDGSY